MLLIHSLKNWRKVEKREKLVPVTLHFINPYFLCSYFMDFVHLISQFNCFLLMPVVDKLPALLREDLESAFGDDLDNVFDITNLHQSLSRQKQDTEIELKRVDS